MTKFTPKAGVLRPSTDLVLKAQAGCQESFTEVFKLSKGLIHKVAMKFAQFTNYDDAFQAASVGLIHAVRKFRPNRGEFSTFCYYSLLAYALEFSKRYRHVVTLCRNRTTEQCNAVRVKSFSAPVKDTGLTFFDVFYQTAANEDVETDLAMNHAASKVHEILEKSKCLNDVDRAIIKRRLMGEETLESIARSFGVAREYIRQRECKLLKSTLPRLMASLESAVVP